MEDAEHHPRTTAHALILSFPTRTHLIPCVQLAKRLAAVAGRDQMRLEFTAIVSYEGAGDLGGHGSDPAFTLRTIAVPDGPVADGQRGTMVGMIQACRNMRAPTLRLMPHLLQFSPPLSLVIADVFVPWAAELAASASLPFFYFYTTTASSGCVMSHAPSLLATNVIPFQDDRQQEFVTCPGAPMLLPKDFPVSMQLQDVGHPQLQFTLNMFSDLHKASGFVLNTCEEIEKDAIKVLRMRCPVYTVGPLFLPLDGDQTASLADEKEIRDTPVDDCTKWLDMQAPDSVLYVCFGTLANFSNEQMMELAWGLEQSRLPFLWVVHKNVFDGMVSDALPDGFMDRMKDRCFVTSWVPQLEVLKHRSVGGFFSHCGWNSILENIALKGVPMLCWPDKAEQGVNARLVVDVWKLGVPFKVGKDCAVSRDEVKEAVMMLMQGETTQEMRMTGRDLNKEVESVTRKNGSSVTNMEALVIALTKTVLNGQVISK